MVSFPVGATSSTFTFQVAKLGRVRTAGKGTTQVKLKKDDILDRKNTHGTCQLPRLSRVEAYKEIRVCIKVEARWQWAPDCDPLVGQ